MERDACVYVCTYMYIYMCIYIFLEVGKYRGSIYEKLSKTPGTV